MEVVVKSWDPQYLLLVLKVIGLRSSSSFSTAGLARRVSRSSVYRLPRRSHISFALNWIPSTQPTYILSRPFSVSIPISCKGFSAGIQCDISGGIHVTLYSFYISTHGLECLLKVLNLSTGACHDSKDLSQQLYVHVACGGGACDIFMSSGAYTNLACYCLRRSVSIFSRAYLWLYPESLMW